MGTRCAAASKVVARPSFCDIPRVVCRSSTAPRLTGARELRIKESDRITALVENFRSLGVAVEELDDGLEIEGSDRPVRGQVDAYDDHRIAMAFAILGALPGNDITIRNRGIVDVSFPGFWNTLDRLAPRAISG